MPFPPAFVITGDAARMTQFRASWAAVGLAVIADAVAEWRACLMPEFPSLGNAIAQYALIRHAAAAGLPAVVVFEDDAIPCNDCSNLLEQEIAAATVRGVSALRLGWIPYPDDAPPNDARGALGSHAFALLSPDAMEDYCNAWAQAYKADLVFSAMRGRVECASKNLFAQYVPRRSVVAAIHGAAGRINANPVLADLRSEYAARFSAALNAAKKCL